MSKGPIVLGLHPSPRGYGWALFKEIPPALEDWGVVDIRRDKNAVALGRIEAQLDKQRPTVLAMEQHDAVVARRSERIRELYLAIQKRAEARSIEVRYYTRAEISKALHFESVCPRRAVPAAVAERLPVLKPRLLKPRRIWIGERSSMSMFCAAACALAHFDAHP